MHPFWVSAVRKDTPTHSLNINTLRIPGTPMSTRSSRSRSRKMLNMSGTSSVFSSVSTATTQSRRRGRVTREMLLEIVGVFEKQQKDTLRDVARLQRELDNANRRISKLSNADLNAEKDIKLEDDVWEGQDAMSQREARLFAQLKRWRVEQQKVLDAQREWRVRGVRHWIYSM